MLKSKCCSSQTAKRIVKGVTFIDERNGRIHGKNACATRRNDETGPGGLLRPEFLASDIPTRLALYLAPHPAVPILILELRSEDVE